MTPYRLETRIDRLFGREPDLRALLQRTQRHGLSAIIGPPQIGKSWLLMELAHRLASDPDRPSLVGFTRSPKGANDPLLQVVSDLYHRWLADAGAREQLKAAYTQQKNRLLPAFARFIGKLSEKAAESVPLLGPIGGTAIREALEALVTASDDLRTGGMIVSRLEYKEAQELVSSVRAISGRPIILVMDQWEETTDLARQVNLFRDILREPEQWRNCHILLAARETGEASGLLRDLEAEFPGSAQLHALDRMNLTDAGERNRLLSFLRGQPHLSALADLADEHVMEIIAGYPRVISRWIAEDSAEAARTSDGLKQLATDAHAFLYRELKYLLLALDGDHRRLAARIALLPLVESPPAWDDLRPVILSGLDLNALDDLKLRDVLERRAAMPTFGHPTRRDAARTILEDNRPEAVRAEAQSLIPHLVRRVTTIDASVTSFVAALRDLNDTAVQHHLGVVPSALCMAARLLFDERLPSVQPLIDGVRAVCANNQPDGSFMLSNALFNALNTAKAEGDLVRCNLLLDALRVLAGAFPDEPGVRRSLAMGLVNTQNAAKVENDLARRDAILGEVQSFAKAYPDDPDVQTGLAISLHNALIDAKAEDNLNRRDAFLDELRTLAGRHCDNPEVIKYLAKSLFNTLNYAKAEHNLAIRDDLLDELRTLAGSHPDETQLREQLVAGLFNRMNHAIEENDMPRRDDLLDELRTLASGHADDPQVREKLAMGLVNSMNHVKPGSDLRCRDALLEELRTLATIFPDDPRVRKQLAMGLANGLVHTNAAGDVDRRDALLRELSTLVRRRPDQPELLRCLAVALSNMGNYAKAEIDPARRDILLGELRSLASAHTDDPHFRGLIDTLY